MTLLVLPLLAALFSVLHGADRIQHGYAIAFHSLAVSVVCVLLLPSFWLLSAGAGAASALLYWVTLRRGKQARDELDFMSGKIWVGLEDIAHNYWPVLTGVPLMALTGHYWPAGALVGLMFLPALVSLECNINAPFGKRWQARDKAYADKHNKPRFWEMRRATEIASGITGGFWGACLVIAGSELI